MNIIKRFKRYVDEWLDKRWYDKYARKHGFKNWKEYTETIRQND
jgi:hypothetical protein